MSDIQSISQGNYILQGTVATSAGIVGDGSPNNPLRADEMVLYSGNAGTSAVILSEPVSAFEAIKIVHNTQVEEVYGPLNTDALRYWHFYGTPSQGVYKIAMVNCAITNNIQITNVSAKTFLYPVTGTATAYTVSLNDTYALNTIRKVIGINRINNA